MTHPISIGTKVPVTVVKILATGLLVALPQGESGVIRQRELGWQGSSQKSWQKRFAVGQRLEAVVIAHREQTELSLRFVERDPWQDVAERLEAGALVAGEVTGVTGYGAFVELEPGVTGLLHQSQLPAWVSVNIYDLFWVGDRVRVEVVDVDPCNRTVELSMKSVATHRWRHNRRQWSSPPGRQRATAPAPISPGTPRARSILLIEEDPTQSQVLVEWLRNAGYAVESAPDAARGVTLLHERKPEIVLANFPLSREAGSELLQYISAPQHPLHTVLMLDLAAAAGHAPQIAALAQQGVSFLHKPLLPQELLDALAHGDAFQKHTGPRTAYPVRRFREQSLIISGTPFATRAEYTQPGDTQPGDTQSEHTQPRHAQSGNPQPAHLQPDIAATEATSTQRAIQASLLNLRRQTGASTVVLFELDPQQRRVHVVAHRGKETPHSSALGDLIHSPVRDVAEDELVVQVGDAERSAAYVRYLRPLLPFHSCVGVPVPGNLPARHALFLFSRRAGLTGTAIVRDAGATATVLGALLEQGAFLERAADMQSAIVLGQLSRALVHETNHQLSPILFALGDLERHCGQVINTADQAPINLKAQLETAQQTLQQLSQHVQKLVNTTHLFGRLTVQDAPTMVRLDSTIQQCIALVRDTADRAKVSLHFDPPAHLITTRVKESQLQQVLLNVLLNAIQQIELYRPGTGGAIHLHVEIDKPKRLDSAAPQSEVSAGADRKVIRIVVEDDGPGIHQRLWRRIFDLGFTTRQGEGSGLGLFLSRRLLADHGGAIYVQESAICWGTRMAIEVPIQVV